ncbi:MAG: hypothetical protein IJB65_05880 [Clostridia bacterium]|nr:hypothetical protein [Clostridia bacterium]
MSNKEQIRRVSAKVFFDGVDISDDIDKYLLSLTYTDNESGETDDLQIKLCDKDDIWLKSWLNKAIWAASASSYSAVASKKETSVSNLYKVSAKTGAAVHSRPGVLYYVYGTLPYGTVITVSSISDGWANFVFSGKNAYVRANLLTSTQASYNSSPQTSYDAEWQIGDAVIANGAPHESSYGSGKTGAVVTNYESTVTYLNLKAGVPYPICVGNIGWFAVTDVKHRGSASSQAEYDGACKGMKIQAVLVRHNWTGNGEDEVLDCGSFELDGVGASGPPSAINIKATSLTYNSSARQTKHSKSWESYYLKGIAEEIAQKNGMTCVFCTAKNPFYERVEQYKTSDIAFLNKLCSDAGCALKCTNNIIVIFDSVAAASSKSMVIDRNKLPSDTKYNLTTQQNSAYTSCRVSYVTPSGQLIEATAYVDDYDAENDKNQCYEVSQKVSNTAEAKALAATTLKNVNKFSINISFTFPFTTTLFAGSCVELVNYGYWSGIYAVSQAKHSIGSSASTTQITLRKLTASEIEENGKTTYNANKSIEQLALEVIRGEWGTGQERRRRLTEENYDYNAVQTMVNQILSKGG